ncbi:MULTISPECIES: hypothetical protein [unclassified Caballeronia]|nr:MULTISPECIES: hypothetical protein [unclassified Caballeronia]MCE4544185.1 hypothetical protein [Caballeronia sp. PC1]MCE4571336.1 hypothetical protein [Caballeronia sp. CLC5]
MKGAISVPHRFCKACSSVEVFSYVPRAGACKPLLRGALFWYARCFYFHAARAAAFTTANAVARISSPYDDKARRDFMSGNKKQMGSEPSRPNQSNESHRQHGQQEKSPGQSQQGQKSGQRQQNQPQPQHQGGQRQP